MARPQGGPAASNSGKIFDSDLWNRMHYNEVKESSQANLTGAPSKVGDDIDRRGGAFERVDTRTTTVHYAGRTARGAGGGARERTMRDVKKDIAGRLSRRREKRIREEGAGAGKGLWREPDGGSYTVEVGGGAGGCVVS